MEQPIDGSNKLYSKACSEPTRPPGITIGINNTDELYQIDRILEFWDGDWSAIIQHFSETQKQWQVTILANIPDKNSLVDMISGVAFDTRMTIMVTIFPGMVTGCIDFDDDSDSFAPDPDE